MALKSGTANGIVRRSTRVILKENHSKSIGEKKR